MGSNIFNILFILGITAFINPVSLNASAIIDVVILLGITSFVLVVAFFKRHVGRLNGFNLINELYRVFSLYHHKRHTNPIKRQNGNRNLPFFFYIWI